MSVLLSNELVSNHHRLKKFNQIFHVPYVSSKRAHKLKEEIDENGWDITLNRCLTEAQSFRNKGDEENAQEKEREAGYIKAVFPPKG